MNLASANLRNAVPRDKAVACTYKRSIFDLVERKCSRYEQQGSHERCFERENFRAKMSLLLFHLGHEAHYVLLPYSTTSLFAGQRPKVPVLPACNLKRLQLS